MVDLGCVHLCGAIETTHIAATTGIYMLQGIFNGRFIQKTQAFEAGDLVNFDTDGIPEHYLLEMELTTPLGAIVDTYKFLIIGSVFN